MRDASGKIAEIAGCNCQARIVVVTSRMNGGVIFADGMEQDFLAFDWGRRVSVGPAAHALHLVTG